MKKIHAAKDVDIPDFQFFSKINMREVIEAPVDFFHNKLARELHRLTNQNFLQYI